MNLQEIILSSSSPQLCHGFYKGHALDIAHSTTKLNDADIWLLIRIIDGYSSDLLDPVHNRIRDMRHDLHRLAQVVATSLALDDVLIDLARRYIVVTREGDVQIALVVAEVEVDFTAVGEDEYFAMPNLLLNGCLRELKGARKTYSLGFIVPASTLRYGSTLMDDTFWDVSTKALYASNYMTYLQTTRLEQETSRGGCDA